MSSLEVDDKTTFRWRYFLSEINNESIGNLIDQLEAHHQENSEKPVCLFVSCRGGEMSFANGFYRWVKFLGLKLVTIGMGEIASSGLLVFLAGTKRFILPDTYYYFHVGQTGITKVHSPEESKALLAAFEYEVKCMKNIVLQETSIPLTQQQEFDEGCGIWSSDQLVEYGFAEAVVSSLTDPIIQSQTLP